MSQASISSAKGSSIDGRRGTGFLAHVGRRWIGRCSPQAYPLPSPWAKSPAALVALCSLARPLRIVLLVGPRARDLHATRPAPRHHHVAHERAVVVGIEATGEPWDASNLVLAAHSEGTYEQALNALMATEGRLRKEQVDAALLRAGLDPTGLHLAFKRDAKRIDAIIARNMAQASAFNLGGTPAFVIGRKIYPGLMNEKALKEAIAEARKGEHPT